MIKRPNIHFKVIRPDDGAYAIAAAHRQQRRLPALTVSGRPRKGSFRNPDLTQEAQTILDAVTKMAEGAQPGSAKPAVSDSRPPDAWRGIAHLLATPVADWPQDDVPEDEDVGLWLSDLGTVGGLAHQLVDRAEFLGRHISGVLRDAAGLRVGLAMLGEAAPDVPGDPAMADMLDGTAHLSDTLPRQGEDEPEPLDDALLDAVVAAFRAHAPVADFWLEEHDR